MIDVSIVIVSYNTKDVLDKCLNSVFADSPSLSREVIVVDNASADGSRELLAEKWSHVNAIVNDDNVGYAPACNQGLRVATGRYKLALNSDAFIDKDVLAKMVEFMDTHTDVAAVGPKLLNSDGSLQLECARLKPTFWSNLVTFTPLYRLRRLRRYAHRYETDEFYTSTNRAQVLLGACILFRTSMLDEIGLLDERLILNCDDVEWCARANEMGYPVMYYPEVQVVHLGGESRGFDPTGMHTKNIESLANYLDISRSAPSAFFLKACMVSGTLPVLLRNAIAAPFVPRRRKRAALQWKLFRKGLQLLVRRCPN